MNFFLLMLYKLLLLHLFVSVYSVGHGRVLCCISCCHIAFIYLFLFFRKMSRGLRCINCYIDLFIYFIIH